MWMVKEWRFSVGSSLTCFHNAIPAIALCFIHCFISDYIVRCAYLGFYRLCQMDQNCIACLMSVPVVHLLEKVKVHQESTDREPGLKSESAIELVADFLSFVSVVDPDG